MSTTTNQLSDDLNPIFILQGTHTDLLIAAAAGRIDLQDLARQQLANRGLDQDGRYVGFKRANEAAARANTSAAVETTGDTYTVNLTVTVRDVEAPTGADAAQFVQDMINEMIGDHLPEFAGITTRIEVKK
jgi:hypothetical protein